MVASISVAKLLLVVIYGAIYWLLTWFAPDGPIHSLPSLLFHLVTILLICLSYDRLYPFVLLGLSSGKRSGESQLAAFAKMVDKMHECTDLDGLLEYTSDALRDLLLIQNTTIFLKPEATRRTIKSETASQRVSEIEGQATSDESKSGFRLWKRRDEGGPGRVLSPDSALLRSIPASAPVFTLAQCSVAVREELKQLNADLALTVVHGGDLLCIILAQRVGTGQGRTTAPAYSPLELQLLGLTASQLGIAFDRIDEVRREQQEKEASHEEKLALVAGLSATIAHEMRTPLSGVRASIVGVESYLPDLLRAYDFARSQDEDSFNQLRVDHRDMLLNTPARIKSMVDQAGSVIDLLLVNLRNKELDRASFHLCSMARSVAEAVESYPLKKNETGKIHCCLEQDFDFLGLQSMVVYVLFNLLKNALYSIESARKGEITIKLERGKLERGEEVNKLVFTDTGPGIPAAAQARIFDSFFTTKAEGTGAGLAFCARTMANFGGSISVESEEGEYTTFTLVFPAVHRTKTAATPSPRKRELSEPEPGMMPRER